MSHHTPPSPAAGHIDREQPVDDSQGPPDHMTSMYMHQATPRSQVPNPARMYDYCLGGKDNYAVDRQAVLSMLDQSPDTLDAARNNRQFLFRAVRYLARNAGIEQFLDMGSGLPAQNNVDTVARSYRPNATVVYVDNDPAVVTYGRALLATDPHTTMLDADLTTPQHILTDPQALRLLDLTRPVAVLLLSVGHLVADDATLHGALATVRAALAPGSFLAFTQLVGVNQNAADESNAVARELGIQWKTRLAHQITGFMDGLEPVHPGLVDITGWRRDPNQPPLGLVDAPLRPYLGASQHNQRFMQFGGVARVP